MRNEVLIVSRNAGASEILRERLLALGYVVPAIATSGRFAINAAIDFRPVLVFVDCQFSADLDAGEVISALRDSLGIPLVLFADSEASARAAGGELICAPFPAGPVTEAIAHAVEAGKAARNIAAG
ncbi:MAG: hypothetical protein AB7Q97_12180 [Gammaproteobacteria bacterium]